MLINIDCYEDLESIVVFQEETEEGYSIPTFMVEKGFIPLEEKIQGQQITIDIKAIKPTTIEIWIVSALKLRE